jgi:cob(I)alamin adenosyltransferase
MKIYSEKGDTGFTSGLNGLKMPKNDTAIHFLGTVDELNSHLGLIKAILSNEDTWQFTWKSSCYFIKKIKKKLFKMMAFISKPPNSHTSYQTSDIPSGLPVNDFDVKYLEKEIDILSENIPWQHEFKVPGINIIEAQIQITRTVARRAERLYIAMGDSYKLNGFSLCPETCKYLNRLSDYLFVLSQQDSLVNVNFINQITGI